ncbi:MAG: sugar ABC transporter permease [Clostridia bacterium]|nr:sugar ABC transporter permease [Clostridia bacterium]
MEKKLKSYQSKNLITGTWKAKLFYGCVIAIPVLQCTIFVFIVLLNSVFLSFKQYDYGTGEYIFKGNIFQNYKVFWSTISSSGSSLGIATKNSLILWFWTSLVGISLALFFSFYIVKKYKGSEFFKTMLFLPTIVSTIAMSLIYRRFVDRFLSDFLEQYFGVDIGTPFYDEVKMRFVMVVLYSCLMGFGTQVLMYTGVMSRIPESLSEYASLDGINAFQEFIHITLPLIYPTISTFLVAGIGAIFTAHGSMYDFYGPYAESTIQTVGYFLYNRTVGDGKLLAEYPLTAAYGVAFTLITVPTTLIARWVLDRLSPEVEY